MPRIPKFQATKLPPGESGAVAVNPSILAKQGQVMKEAGGVIGGMGRITDTLYQKDKALKEKEQLARDTLAAIEIQNKLEKSKSDFAESLKTRSDSENFEADAIKLAESHRAYFLSVNPNPSQRLTLAAEASFGSFSNTIVDVARVKKWDIMGKQANAEADNMQQRSMEAWAKANSDKERAFISKNFEMNMLVLGALVKIRLLLPWQLFLFELKHPIVE